MSDRYLTDREMRTLNAWHEAGHAVALVVLGGVISRAWLSAAGGQVDGDIEDGPGRTASLLVVGMAGRAGATEYLARVFDQSRSTAWAWAESGSRDDIRQARRTARGTWLSLSRAEDRARRLVRARWRQVRDVARVLDRDGSVSDARVRSITGTPRPTRGAA